MRHPRPIIAALALVGAFASPAGADAKDKGDKDKHDLEIKIDEVRDNGRSLTVDGEVKGLDDRDGDVTVRLRARGDVIYRCERKGKDRRHEDEIRLSGKDRIRERDIDRRGTEFRVRTREARDHDVDDHRCDKVDVRDVEFNRFRVFVRQGGDRIAARTCWFDHPTDDGKIRRKQFECSRTRSWDDDDDWGDWHDEHWGEEAPAGATELGWR